MHRQSLSFEVRIAQTAEDLAEARRVRAQSYGHHLPALGATMLLPDSFDTGADTFVVLCVDKATQCVVGTARFQTNASAPLHIEGSITLPPSMLNDTRAEVSRLSAIRGADPLVKLALMKCSYLFCTVQQVRWLVIGARSAALLRQYEGLGFHHCSGGRHVMPLRHAGNIDHYVLSFNVTTAQSVWREAKHPLYRFMVDTVHPDIQLISTPTGFRSP